MKRFIKWLNPDLYIRPARALMLAVYVASASAVIALVVHGKTGEAFLLGFLFGAAWGITRPRIKAPPGPQEPG
ncbi:MAG: hypothetical protein LC808_31355 [Actinobacteria bacterium]|nr:hypothetical protein [Actinomycetota bacterium]